MMKIRTFLNRLFFAKLEETQKSRTELRQQVVIVEGKLMRCLEYIDLVARKLPYMEIGGKAVDHRQDMRDLYNKYDMLGVNFYVKKMNRIIDRDVKKIAGKIKVKSS